MSGAAHKRVYECPSNTTHAKGRKLGDGHLLRVRDVIERVVQEVEEAREARRDHSDAVAGARHAGWQMRDNRPEPGDFLPALRLAVRALAALCSDHARSGPHVQAPAALDLV